MACAATRQYRMLTIIIKGQYTPERLSRNVQWVFDDVLYVNLVINVAHDVPEVIHVRAGVEHHLLHHQYKQATKVAEKQTVMLCQEALQGLVGCSVPMKLTETCSCPLLVRYQQFNSLHHLALHFLGQYCQMPAKQHGSETAGRN